MVESAIVSALASNATLTAMLSTFAGAPAIFSDYAPEQAVMPYVVFRVENSGVVPGGAVDEFDIFIEYYDVDAGSRAASRLAGELVEEILDGAILQHARYSDIRISKFSNGPESEGDGRDIVFRVQMQARAVRLLWLSKI